MYIDMLSSFQRRTYGGEVVVKGRTPTVSLASNSARYVPCGTAKYNKVQYQRFYSAGAGALCPNLVSRAWCRESRVRRSYETLRSTPPTLMRHVLMGAAPVRLDAADEREHGGQNQQLADLHMHLTLLRGEMRLRTGSRCALSTAALRLHEPFMQTIARAQILLEESGLIHAAAQDAVQRSQVLRARVSMSSLST